MKNVLVLEDDSSNLQIFSTVLWSKGFNVLKATTARAALEAARRRPNIDLFVSDVALKADTMSGTDVAVALARARKTMPVLFVSGTPLEGWLERDRRNLRLLLRSGVEMLEKPFLLGVFEDAVDRLLGKVANTADPSGQQVSNA